MCRCYVQTPVLHDEPQRRKALYSEDKETVSRGVLMLIDNVQFTKILNTSYLLSSIKIARQYNPSLINYQSEIWHIHVLIVTNIRKNEHTDSCLTSPCAVCQLICEAQLISCAPLRPSSALGHDAPNKLNCGGGSCHEQCSQTSKAGKKITLVRRSLDISLIIYTPRHHKIQ